MPGIVRHGIAQQTARFLFLFKYGDGIARPFQLRRAGQARGACADDGDAVSVWLRFAPRGLPALRLAVFQHEALEFPDLDRRVHAAAHAGILAGVLAHEGAEILQGI